MQKINFVPRTKVYSNYSQESVTKHGNSMHHQCIGTSNLQIVTNIYLKLFEEGIYNISHCCLLRLGWSERILLPKPCCFSSTPVLLSDADSGQVEQITVGSVLRTQNGSFNINNNVPRTPLQDCNSVKRFCWHKPWEQKKHASSSCHCNPNLKLQSYSRCPFGMHYLFYMPQKKLVFCSFPLSFVV